MGVKSSDMEKFSKEEQMEFLAKHGGKICRMIALTLGRTVYVKPLTWFVRHFVRYEYQMAAVREFVRLTIKPALLYLLSDQPRRQIRCG